MQRLYHSPVGRAWIAIRENEIAAASVGVPVVQMKLLAFSLSAAIAAVAGVLSGAKDGFVSPAICEFQQSIMVLAMVILGGLGNSYGALLGAALLYLVPEYLKLLPSTHPGQRDLQRDRAAASCATRSQHLSDYRLLLFGAVMVIMMLYRPQGLLGSSRRKTEMLHHDAAARNPRPEQDLRRPEGRAEHGVEGKRPGPGEPSGARQVDSKRGLVAVDGIEIGRAAGVVVGRAPGTGVIAAAGALDLDHLGPEVGEQHRRERAGEHAREIEDAQARQRARPGFGPRFVVPVAHVAVS